MQHELKAWFNVQNTTFPDSRSVGGSGISGCFHYTGGNDKPFVVEKLCCSFVPLTDTLVFSTSEVTSVSDVCTCYTNEIYSDTMKIKIETYTNSFAVIPI